VKIRDDSAVAAQAAIGKVAVVVSPECCSGLIQATYEWRQQRRNLVYRLG